MTKVNSTAFLSPLYDKMDFYVSIINTDIMCHSDSIILLLQEHGSFKTRPHSTAHMFLEILEGSTMSQNQPYLYPKILIYLKIISKIRVINIINGNREPPEMRHCLDESFYHLLPYFGFVCSHKRT